MATIYLDDGTENSVVGFSGSDCNGSMLIFMWENGEVKGVSTDILEGFHIYPMVGPKDASSQN